MKDLQRISADINTIVNTALSGDFSEDPLGFSYLLFVCLKHSYENPKTELLSEWMNEWADRVLNKQELSRAVDKEITSAIIAYLSLSRSGKLHKEFKPDQCYELLSKFFNKEKGLFNNFLFSSVLYIYLHSEHLNTELYSDTLQFLEAKLRDKDSLFNDPSNLLAWALVCKEAGWPQHQKELFEYCYRRIKDNSLLFQQKLYYAYVLWLFKKYGDKAQRTDVKNLVYSTVSNFVLYYSEPQVPVETEQLYGQPPTPQVPALSLATCFDLVNMAKPEVEVILREELSKPSLFTRFGGIICSIIGLTLMLALLAGLLKINGLIKINALALKNQLVNSFVWADFFMLISGIAINLGLILLLGFLGILIYFVIADVVLKSVPYFRIIWSDAKKHFKTVLLLGIGIGVLANILTIFFM